MLKKKIEVKVLNMRFQSAAFNGIIAIMLLINFPFWFEINLMFRKIKAPSLFLKKKQQKNKISKFWNINSNDSLNYS